MSKRKSFWEVDSDNARSQRATRRAKRKRMHLPLIYSEDVQKAVAKYLGKKHAECPTSLLGLHFRRASHAHGFGRISEVIRPDEGTVLSQVKIEWFVRRKDTSTHSVTPRFIKMLIPASSSPVEAVFHVIYTSDSVLTKDEAVCGLIAKFTVAVEEFPPFLIELSPTLFRTNSYVRPHVSFEFPAMPLCFQPNRMPFVWDIEPFVRKQILKLIRIMHEAIPSNLISTKEELENMLSTMEIPDVPPKYGGPESAHPFWILFQFFFILEERFWDKMIRFRSNFDLDGKDGTDFPTISGGSVAYKKYFQRLTQTEEPNEHLSLVKIRPRVGNRLVFQ